MPCKEILLLSKDDHAGLNSMENEPTPVELRKKVVADFARDVAEGRIFLSVDQTKWRQQDVELIGTTTSRLIRDLADYVSGTVAGEEFEFLEKQLFFSISVLRTYDAIKTNLDESKVEEGIRRLESKIDLINMQLSKMLQPQAKGEKAPPPKDIKSKRKTTVEKKSPAVSEKTHHEHAARADTSSDEDEGFF